MSILNNRYQLKNQLFSSQTIGDLYQARDIKPDKGADSADVLLHILPGNIFSYPAYKAACADLKTIEQPDLNVRLLNILECGWTGEKAFFVIESPASWSFKALPPTGASPATTLHQRASSVIGQLNQAGLSRNSLESRFFIVTSEGELHLLGTALSKTIQQQTKPANWLNAQAANQAFDKKIPSWSRFGILLGIGSIMTIAGATGIYTVWKSQPRHLSPLMGMEQTVLLETDVTTNPIQDTLVSTDVNKPETAEAKVIEPTSVELKTTQPETTQPETTQPETTQPETTQPETVINWNGMDEEKLLQRSNNAFSKGHLQTALYFARILWRQGSRHTDLLQLIKDITKHYQQDAVEMIIQENSAQATLSVQQAERLINEFGLEAHKELQEQLKDKLEG